MSLNCNCNNNRFCNPFVHRLLSATAGTSLVLTVPNTPKIDFYSKDDNLYYPDIKNTKLSVLHVANLMF